MFKNHQREKENRMEPALRSRILVAVILSVLCVLPLIGLAKDTRLVTVVDGEESFVMMTTEDDAETLADMAGMPLGEYDQIVETNSTGMNTTLEIDRAVFVSVEADGQKIKVGLIDGTVADVLELAGVTLNEHDFCSPALKESITDRMRIVITRARCLTVVADGQEQEVVLYGGTVAGALAKAGVTLGENDLCNYPLDTETVDGMKIVVDRVTYETVTQIESIPFDVERIDSTVLYKGVEKTSRRGREGERTIVHLQKYINGELVSSEVVRDEVTKKPINKIVRVGTRAYPNLGIQDQLMGENFTTNGGGSGATPNSASWRATVKSDGTLIDHLGNPVAYQTMISGTATAYYTETVSGTATGRIAQYGVVAVNPKVIPYGTMMYICSPDGSIVYGYAVAGDTGGTLMAGSARVDLYYDNIQQCYWFGAKRMNLYIVK